ncbi:MAG: selenide, water dikinase SelD [Pseudohongiellaceae bacterium]
MNSSSPIVKHLVLVGGGHSHLAVLKQLGMKPVAGLAVTLISREVYTPYSGSLPAHICGHRSLDEMHIDLRPLCQFSGVRLLQAEVTDIDLSRKHIKLQGRPEIPFDLISLNIGSSPDLTPVKGGKEHGVPIKPINSFLNHWHQISSTASNAIKQGKPYRLTIIGGGPASIELAFAAHYKIHTDAGLPLDKKSPVEIKVISRAATILGSLNKKAQDAVLQAFKKRHIHFIASAAVVEINSTEIVLETGATVPTDNTVLATGASIPSWPKDCGLALSEDGFIEINEQLQSSSHSFVFAAGDAATIKNELRPKSGVYAVRQGKVLAKNLIKAATGRPLSKYAPQKSALVLLNLGDKSALAIRDSLFFQGAAVWKLKDYIDNSFVQKYTQLPSMELTLDISPGLVDKKTESELRAHAMRCAGCGAKVAGSILDEVLSSLEKTAKPDVIEPPSKVEDASQIQLKDQRRLIQSIDQIKAFTNDPMLFGKIATNHCLSDVYAMGVEPHSALALAGIPFASKRYTRSQLQELMQGCAEALAENDCALIGGHSAETQELQFGLCVNGFAEHSVLSKSAVNVGDLLILSKPLGTGTLLAADMRYRASHHWMEATMNSMLVSNRLASAIFVEHCASACTDITGFGLAGHLLEMLEGLSATAELELHSVPALNGALHCIRQGIFSSLHTENALVIDSILNTESFVDDPTLQLLFDPQTAGGLLAAVNPANAEDCVDALRNSGLSEAVIIGNISSISEDHAAIVLK